MSKKFINFQNYYIVRSRGRQGGFLRENASEIERENQDEYYATQDKQR